MMRRISLKEEVWRKLFSTNSSILCELPGWVSLFSLSEMAMNDNIFFDDTHPVNSKAELDRPNIPNLLVGELSEGSDPAFLQHCDRIYKLIIHEDRKLGLRS